MRNSSALLLSLPLLLGGALLWWAWPESAEAETRNALVAGLGAAPEEAVQPLDLPDAPTLDDLDALIGRDPVTPERVDLTGEEDVDSQPSRGPRSQGIGEFPAKPEPGVYDGPQIDEAYESGVPYFEAQQRQNEAGVWLLHGRWTAWHENGRVQESGWYEDHQESGDWKWWDENGQLIAEGTFIDGKREGIWNFWYEDGTRQMDARYSGGEGQGLWTLYFDNGSKCAEGQYVDGEISGYWTIWDEFGEVNYERTGTYEHGQRLSD